MYKITNWGLGALKELNIGPELPLLFFQKCGTNVSLTSKMFSKVLKKVFEKKLVGTLRLEISQ
jgi:hypothetical protein